VSWQNLAEGKEYLRVAALYGFKLRVILLAAWDVPRPYSIKRGHFESVVKYGHDSTSSLSGRLGSACCRKKRLSSMQSSTIVAADYELTFAEDRIMTQDLLP